jgi:hypothetical protein
MLLEQTTSDNVGARRTTSVPTRYSRAKLMPSACR